MTTLQQALQIARVTIADADRYITATFVQPTLRDLLDALRRGEDEAVEAYAKLLELRRLGIDHPGDYVVYRRLRAELFEAQLEVRAVLGSVIRRAAPQVYVEAMQRIPKPQLLPALTYDHQATLEARQGGGRALSGLGDPVTITTGAGIAIAVGVVIAALGLGYMLSQTLISVTQELAGVLIAQARAVQFAMLCRARLEAYNACLERGGTAADCAATAASTVPTPLESGTQTPDPGATDIRPWILVGAASTIVVLGAIAGVYFWWRAPRPLGRVPVRQVSALPSRAPDLDGSKSAYNLEIGGGLGGTRKRKPRKRKPARNDWGAPTYPYRSMRASREELDAFYASDEARDMGESPRMTAWEDED